MESMVLKNKKHPGGEVKLFITSVLMRENGPYICFFNRLTEIGNHE